MPPLPHCRWIAWTWTSTKLDSLPWKYCHSIFSRKGADRPSNPQESGQIKQFHALKSTKKVQGFDDFWASNPQNRGHQLAGASRGLLSLMIPSNRTEIPSNLMWFRWKFRLRRLHSTCVCVKFKVRNDDPQQSVTSNIFSTSPLHRFLQGIKHGSCK